MDNVNDNDLFNKFKNSLLNIDIVHFCEKYLQLDGKPFSLTNNGYKPFADIYRYLSLKALEPTSKPVVLVKGRQVGATTMASALELYFGCSGLFGNFGRPPLRLLHCFPLQMTAENYTKTKLNSLITSSNVENNNAINNKAKRSKSYIESKLDQTSPSNNNSSYKKFNGGETHIQYTGEDGNRLRSFTVDAVLFDEYQDLPRDAVTNITKSLTKAMYGSPGEGIQLYFGTPKKKGSSYWKTWMASSRQYYHLFCEKCQQHFPLYLPDGNKNDSWEKIWIEDDLDKHDPNHGFIVQCPHCQHQQNKIKAAENGKWIATNPDLDCKYIGFHINQLYIPDLPRKKIISEKPENHENNTDRSYQNEILGEFFEGDSSPITVEQIKEKCAEYERSYVSGIPKELGKKVYLGLDWGKKNATDTLEESKDRKAIGKSYSSAVILTAEGPHLLSIEFALLLKNNDPDYKQQLVEEMMRKYSVTLAVGDIGYSEDLSVRLHNNYQNQYLVSRASGGKIENHVRFKENSDPKEIEFEKDHFLRKIFEKMQKGEIKFPFKNYDNIMWLVNQCCSMDTKPVKDRSGTVIREMYVKGSIPNDGLMSLLNAYLAFLFDLTNGFKQNINKAINNSIIKQSIPCILGHLPGMR